jgi:hypothetical protein
MAKKGLEKVSENSSVAKLTPAEYWEWRTTISEMNEANLKAKISELEVKLSGKDTEIMALRTKLLHATAVHGVKNIVEKSKEEYSKMKGRIEDRLGFSLNSKMIDDITLEVKDAPETKPNIGESVHGTS